MFDNIKRKAFTLAEVMVVLAIVTAVVGVSIQITKSKFESANRYLYYAAYSALRDITAEVHLEVNSQPVGEPEGPYDAPPPGTWVSLPTDESEFCIKFASFVNLSSGASICSGSQKAEVELIANSSEKDFSLLTPDLVLRNGLKLYNMKEIYDPMSLFSDFEIKSENGTKNETQSEYAKKAYKIYVDIDGPRSLSILWEDVFPFYITSNGYVIPAYSDSSSAGANNLEHIAASVEYDDTTTANGRPVSRWLYKNITWQEAACYSGFVNGGYCGTYSVDTKCQKAEGNYSDCRVKVIVPLKG